MLDDWMLEHLAKVTALSSVLIVIYFLIYSIWRISQMPNNPWNWNDWQWPLGGRHAIEIFRNRTEMPFIIALDDSVPDQVGESTFTIKYLNTQDPPEVTVMWGPAATYLMHLINSPWPEFHSKIMTTTLNTGEWLSEMNEATSSPQSWRDTADYFIIEKVRPDWIQNDNDISPGSLSSMLSEMYTSGKLKLTPPLDFDWTLLQNQFRYPAAVFVTSSSSSPSHEYSINGLIQIVHVKNSVFPNPTSTLAQYIKMSSGQSHVLQSLYVLDDHIRDDDSDSEEATSSDGATNPNLPQPPFSDILCSVCQYTPVSRVIIPCRHVCLCTQCFEKVENCPICRGPILYFFKTRPDINSSNDSGANETLTWWQKIKRFNDRFSDAMGLIRQH